MFIKLNEVEVMDIDYINEMRSSFKLKQLNKQCFIDVSVTNLLEVKWENSEESHGKTNKPYFK